MLVNISRWILGLVLLGLSSSVVRADSIDPKDPKFVPIGGCCSIVLTSPTDPAFQISFTKNGSVGTVDCGSFGGPSDDQCIDPLNTEFVNNTHKTWSAITLDITKQSAGLAFTVLDNNAIDPYFAHATSGFLTNGDAFVEFFGIDSTHPGILPAFGCDGDVCSGPTRGEGEGRLLLYDFSILSDVTDMHDGEFFTAQGTATTVPEPATVLLALGGGLLLFLFKRP
jgi:hypothetical protein